MNSSSSSTLLLLLAAALAAAGCDGGPERPSDAAGGPPEVEGSELLAGGGAARWSLLTVPREGGVVRARSLDDPSRVVWEGRTRLPPAREVRLVEGPVVLLRAAGGTVRRYDPRTDRLSRVGEVSDGARWGGWDRYGLWVEPDRSSVLAVGPEGSWRYQLGARPRWATPVDGGRVAVLVDDDGGEAAAVWLVGRGASEPEARTRDGFSGPGLATAWGKRLVLPAGDAVRFYSVPSLTGGGEVEVGGPVTAMAASPSSHELYVAADDPPRLTRVERFAMRVREMTGLPRPVRALRPAVLGSAVLAHDGEGALWVPVGGGDTARAPGRWREDLPLALPGERAVVARDGGAALWRRDGSTVDLDVPGRRRWAPVRWNPAPPPVVSDRVDGTAAGDTPSAGSGRPDTVPADTAAAATGDTAGPEGAAASADTGGAAEPAAGEVPPPGFYAVVTAAREPAGVERQLERLEGAGYPVALQVHRDDAGRRWYRGLVGPYEERPGAEAAARQLRRERGTDAWVTELRAGAATEEIFR